VTIQLAVDVRNAELDAIETAIGVSAIVKIRAGAQPVNCAAADSGTALASFTLASDWAGAASGGSKSFLNTPISTTGLAAGTAGHYRIYASDGVTCKKQGPCQAAGGGDANAMTLDNTSIAVGQAVNITGWTLTAGNA